MKKTKRDYANASRYVTDTLRSYGVPIGTGVGEASVGTDDGLGILESDGDLLVLVTFVVPEVVLKALRGAGTGIRTRVSAIPKQRTAPVRHRRKRERGGEG